MEISSLDVEATVHAGAPWVLSRDLPDPVGWADFGYSPDLTANLINERRSRGVIVSAAHAFPLPKGLAPTNRWLASVDALDELAYRVITGRLAQNVDSALGGEVLSYRLLSGGPGWTVRDFRYGVSARRNRLRDAMANSGFGGLGTLDVKDYYPSIQLEPLRSVLDGIGVTSAVADPLIEILRSWQSEWDVRGVPVGPESSGLLGNIMLISVDKIVADACDPFTRVTDDYLMSIGSNEFPPLVEAVTRELARLSLELNESKVRHFVTRDDAGLRLFDREIEDLVIALRDDGDRGVERVREAFETEARAELPNESRLRWCLKVLCNRGDPFALRLVEESPTIARIDPKGFGAYFSRLVGDKKIDLDWLVSLAVQDATPGSAAIQLQALLACSKARISKALAVPLEEVALHSGDWVPLRCAYVEAWAASEAGKLGHAVEAAIAVGTPQHRRALILSVRRWRPSTKRTAGLTKLRAVAPEALPAIEWISDGCPRLAA
ncbi:RNA-directed DNA polymerase [Nocardioides sp. InS609-2]|uniref:RNA-directed DNA polymerase n=1 Tax=Nocardioides sp. InS609-2 TaxID=2760705 RepID=UPI0020C02310|nr:RNA-directed DNA polymerase [Nocardioides sp. InS609-2]